MAGARVQYPVRTGLRMTEDQRHALQRIAAARGVDAADVIREGIDAMRDRYAHLLRASEFDGLFSDGVQ